MAISTLDGVIAGAQPPVPFAKAVTPTLVAGRPLSTWYLGGSPGAGSMYNSTSGGVALTSSSALVNGQLQHVDPGSGNSYLANLSAAATQAGTLLLCDRLWHGSALVAGAVMSVTSTSAQTLSSIATWPARDRAASTNGDGVQIGLEVYAAMGAGVPTVTLGYTNQAGTTTRSATNIDATVASSAIGAFYRLGLQAGDTGVRTVSSLQLSATMTSGNFGLVAYRVLAAIPLPGAFIPGSIDAVTAGFPKMANGVVPFFLFIPNTTTATYISGTYVETQG